MARDKHGPALAESPHAHPGRDLSFYLVLLVAVAPIWSVVPLSWGFVVYALHSGLVWSFSWKGSCLLALALCEVRPSDRSTPCAPYLISHSVLGVLQRVSLQPRRFHFWSKSQWPRRPA